MKTITGRLTCFCGAIVPWLFLAALCQANESADSLSLRISLDEATQQLLLLPVVVRIELRNEGQTPIGMSAFPFGPEKTSNLSKRAPRYHFTILGPDGSTRDALFADWVNWRLDLIEAANPVQIAPGESLTLDYCLGCAADQYTSPGRQLRDIVKMGKPVFPRPGNYTAQLTLRLPDQGIMKSNALAIAIQEPRSSEDRGAYEILAECQNPFVLLRAPSSAVGRGIAAQGVSSASTPTQEALSEVLFRFPNSRYAPYAQLLYALAQSQKRSMLLTATGVPAQDVAMQIEGIRLLRECASDQQLPRRFRDGGAVLMTAIATRLGQVMDPDVKVRIPSAKTELRNHTEWALDLLRTMPWRNASTGDLRAVLKANPSGLF